MSLKLRFASLLGLFLAGLILTLLGLRRLEQAEAAAMLETDRQARAQLLNHWIDAASRALPQFASDAAESEEFAALLAQPNHSAARAKLAASLQANGVAWFWLLQEDGRVAFHAHAAGLEPATHPPLAAPDFATLVNQTPSPRFFAEHAGSLLEICIRPRPSAAGNGAREWIMVAKIWDDRHLQSLSALSDAKVTLAHRHEIARPASSGGRVELVRPLVDWQGHTLRVLRLDYDVSEIERAIHASSRQSRVFIAFGLLLIGALGTALYGWVLRPLRQIERSLASRDAALVGDLTQQNSELGRVAELVTTSFHQRAALEHEVVERRRTQEALERSEAALRENLAERARLGRDLHDGVIQSLYAAGMGLAGIRMQLQPDQTEAATRLEQTRAALNETIHDVRNFIIGLEPEALKLQTFSQAITALLDVMRGMRAFQSALEVDENLARRLTLAQRVQALQIAREAVSNALRHGHADHIRITLRRHDDFAEFEVADDGRGFDAALAPQGKGLANFAERARELGGELTVDSRPGEGTRVKLSFSLLIL